MHPRRAKLRLWHLGRLREPWLLQALVPGLPGDCPALPAHPGTGWEGAELLWGSLGLRWALFHVLPSGLLRHQSCPQALGFPGSFTWDEMTKHFRSSLRVHLSLWEG
uniref:Uncharacterized protein n=1 Tax=Ficedula albicollis TaxID=59894 RepID=A0A803V4K8_FICAL